MDQAEQLNLDIMDCPECGALAEIVDTQTLEPVDKDMGTIFMWRTQCIDRHIRDNYWYHIEACDDELPELPGLDTPCEENPEFYD